MGLQEEMDAAYEATVPEAERVADFPADLKSIRCPRCGSTAWKRIEDGMEHSEDFLDTATGKASELMDDHHDAESQWKCFGCSTEVADFQDHEADVDDLSQALDEAFTEAVWE